jgi:hypothetical protein
MGMETEIIHLTTLLRRKRAPFGEFLVEKRVLDRFQLFRALQMQDRVPGARLGQCAVALGYIERGAVEQLHVSFERFDTDVLECMTTEAFERGELEIDVEVVYPMP